MLGSGEAAHGVRDLLAELGDVSAS
jgi:hypothetical protein